MNEATANRGVSDHSGEPSREKKRRAKHGGRKPGSRNALTRELTEAVIEAAERVGSDLKGKDGLIGYLMRVGRKDTKAFGSLLRAVLPLRVDLETEIMGERPWTLADFEAHFRNQRIPMPFWMPAFFNDELEQLCEELEKELALEVKLFLKIYDNI